MKILTKRIAANGMLVVLSPIVVFHLLVITGVIPFAIVWGGRLKSYEEMIFFELISIILNLVMLAIVAVNAGILRVKVRRGIIKSGLWAMFMLFVVNTIGNLFSTNEMEKLIFTPLTILLSVFTLRLAADKEAPLSAGETPNNLADCQRGPHEK